MKIKSLLALIVTGVFVFGFSVPSWSALIIEQNFYNDFLSGRNVPDFADASLSTAFSEINRHNDIVGFLTLRDRQYNEPGGVGGGLLPKDGKCWLDFSAGQGAYITFRFPTPGNGLYIEFLPTGYSGDAGSLFKYVSADGIAWQKVGDSSDAQALHTYNLIGDGPETFFRLQVGASAGWYDGIFIDYFKVFEGTVTEPPSDGVEPPPLPPAMQRAPEPATMIFLALGAIGVLIRRRRE